MPRMDPHRVASALLGAAYLAGAVVEAGWSAALLMALPLGVLVAMLWHADVLADFTGSVGLTPIRRTSPVGAVRGLLWALLLVPLVGWLASLVTAR